MIIVGCSFVVVPSPCEATIITLHRRVVSHLLHFFYVGHQGICQVLLETYLRQKCWNFYFVPLARSSLTLW